MQNKKRMKTMIAATAMIGVLAIGGISAYFTDGDTATNTFTVGKVSIDLQEPNWNPPKDITPNQEIKKDPQIKNDGINDAYMFMKVTVPYDNITVVAQDGTKAAAKADTELFSYDVKSGWIEIGTPVKDTNNKTVTHLYAYGTATQMTAEAANQKTGTLFDWVKFVNAREDEGLEGTTKNIKIDAYAIQTQNINDGKTKLDGINSDGKVKPTDVWAVLERQNPTTTVSVKEEANSDIKQGN